MNSNPTWILDLIVSEAEMGDDLAYLTTPIWFAINADGLTSPPIVTKAVAPCRNPRWNHLSRLVLQLTDIGRAYLYVTLVTSNAESGSPESIARSRFGLRVFPAGHPKTFQFPLMLSSNSARLAAKVSFTATLSQIAPAYPLPHSYNNSYPFQQPQPGVPFQSFR